MIHVINMWNTLRYQLCLLYFLKYEVTTRFFCGFPESLRLVQMVCLVSTIIFLKCSGIAKQYFVWRESVQSAFKVGVLYKYEYESETGVVFVLCFCSFCSSCHYCTQTICFLGILCYCNLHRMGFHIAVDSSGLR